MLSEFRGEQWSREEMNKGRNDNCLSGARPARDGGVIPALNLRTPTRAVLMRQGVVWGFHGHCENDITTTLDNLMEKDSK
jgi:hypothetical protein